MWVLFWMKSIAFLYPDLTIGEYEEGIVGHTLFLRKMANTITETFDLITDSIVPKDV